MEGLIARLDAFNRRYETKLDPDGIVNVIGGQQYYIEIERLSAWMVLALIEQGFELKRDWDDGEEIVRIA